MLDTVLPSCSMPFAEHSPPSSRYSRTIEGRDVRLVGSLCLIAPGLRPHCLRWPRMLSRSRSAGWKRPKYFLSVCVWPKPFFYLLRD